MAAARAAFSCWWRQALIGWLPARWKVLLGLSQDRLLLSREQDELRLQWQDAQGLHDLARLPLPLQEPELEKVLGNRLAALPRWLLLPPGKILQRGLLLPAAAAERLRDVVGFEVDRQTPFAAERGALRCARTAAQAGWAARSRTGRRTAARIRRSDGGARRAWSPRWWAWTPATHRASRSG